MEIKARKEALDLMHDMYFVIPQMSLGEAKQCALVAVGKILKVLNEEIRDVDVRGNILLDLIDYYKEVEHEVSLL